MWKTRAMLGTRFFLFKFQVIFTDHSNAVTLIIVIGENFIIGVSLLFYMLE